MEGRGFVPLDVALYLIGTSGNPEMGCIQESGLPGPVVERPLSCQHAKWSLQLEAEVTGLAHEIRQQELLQRARSRRTASGIESGLRLEIEESLDLELADHGRQPTAPCAVPPALHPPGQAQQLVFGEPGCPDTHQSSFIGQGRHENPPSLINLPDHVVVRDADIGEERFVELRPARHLPQGSHLDTRGMHIDDQAGEPTVPRLLSVRTHERKPPPAELRARDPYLLPIERPVPLPALRPGSHCGQV